MKFKIGSSKYLTFQYFIALAMSDNSYDTNSDKNEDENKKMRRIRRPYERNDKPSIRRPIGVSALAIVLIAAAVVMLSSGAYFVAFAPSIHTYWHTSPHQSSYWLTNSANLILSSLVHVTEADIAAFGAISMALAAVPAIVSFGLFRGRSWSRNASIIFFAVASASLLLTIGSRGGNIIIQYREKGYQQTL
ncbi:MAG: hypothetical protein ACJ70Z_03200 [Nitrososphaera sp.]